MNVNNTATNANWNIGAALFYLKWNIHKKSVSFLHPWALKYVLLAIIGKMSGKLIRYRADGKAVAPATCRR